jgi:ATP-dependent Clp protease ATP-binding subunit ClpC
MEHGIMYERFTDRARKVMALSIEEALRIHHEYIGTEHILLGLVKEGNGLGATILKKLNVDLGMVRIEVGKMVLNGPDELRKRNFPLTPRAEQVIENAWKEARELNHDYIGTDHLLLGLLREKDGIAAQVLLNLGLKLEELRNKIIRPRGPLGWA